MEEMALPPPYTNRGGQEYQEKNRIHHKIQQVFSVALLRIMYSGTGPNRPLISKFNGWRLNRFQT